MKKQLRLMSVVLGLSAALHTQAQVAGYSFSHEQGQYTSIADPIYANAVVTEHLVQDNVVTPSKIRLPFPFHFAGQQVDSVSIHGNGYIWFGPAQPSVMGAKWPISAVYPAGVTGIVSAFGVDMHPQPAGAGLSSTVKSAWIGTAPVRMLMIEWEAYSRESAADAGRPDTLNVQIRLYEGSDRVEILYGFCGLNTAIADSGEVGIRGATGSDYSNRVLTGDWSASTAGASPSARTALSASSKPTFGRILTWQYWQAPTGIAAPVVEPNVLSLYPVPAGARLWYAAPEYAAGDASWVIRDMNGRQLMSGSSEHGAGSLDISKLPAGAYIFEIRDKLQCIRRLFSKD